MLPTFQLPVASMARSYGPVNHPGSYAVGFSQQAQGVGFAMLQFQPDGYLGGSHGAIGNQVIGLQLGHTADYRPGDFLRFLVSTGAYTVRAVVAGAAFDDIDFGAGHQRQDIFGLGPDILHPLVAGHMPGDLA